MNSFNKKYVLMFFAVLVVAASLRFFNLGETTLWVDEAVNANNSIGSFESMLHSTRSGNSAPIFMPALLWLFQDFITTPVMARFFPAVFGILTVFVCFMFPLAGVSPRVSFLSGCLIAFSWVQIQYSQEVREYSAGAFLCSVLLFIYLFRAIRQKSLSVDLCFIFLISLSPFVSYGLIFFSATLILLCVVKDLTKHKSITAFTLWTGVLFSIALIACYILTARHQQYVAGGWHLKDLYPYGNHFQKIQWCFNAFYQFIDFNVGIYGASFFLLAVLFFIFFKDIKQFKIPNYYSKSEKEIVLIFLSLVCILYFVSIIRKYPFGGARQLLFAAPIVVLFFSAAIVRLAENLSIFKPHYIAVIVSISLVFCATKLEAVYADNQNIVKAISTLPNGCPDESVFIFENIAPNISYHYPKNKFKQTKAAEIESDFSAIVSSPYPAIYFFFGSSISVEQKNEIEQKFIEIERQGGIKAHEVEHIDGIYRVVVFK